MTAPENPFRSRMTLSRPLPQDEPESRPGGLPLYVWVILAVVVAIPVGIFWGEGATNLELLPKLILRALTALAAPLVVLAILSAIVTNEVKGRVGALMMVFYLINTLVAMLIGLTLSNLIRPGQRRVAGRARVAAPVSRQEDGHGSHHGPDPQEHRRALHSEPSGTVGRAHPGPGDRPGENPRQPKGPR